MTRIETWLVAAGFVGVLAGLAAAWLIWAVVTEPVAVAEVLASRF